MTLITKGMGAIRKVLKSAKKEFVSPKTNIPLYVASGTVLAGKIAYEKVKTKIKGLKKGKK